MEIGRRRQEMAENGVNRISIELESLRLKLVYKGAQVLDLAESIAKALRPRQSR